MWVIFNKSPDGSTGKWGTADDFPGQQQDSVAYWEN